MPSYKEVYASPALKAEDLGDSEPVVTIKDLEIADFDGKAKIVLAFAEPINGSDKTLVVSNINAKRLGHMLGEDYSNWPGNKIQLYTEPFEFKGKIGEAVRVKLRKKAAPKRNSEGEDFNDDLPGF